MALILISMFLVLQRRNKKLALEEAQKRLMQEADFRVKNAELAVLRKQMNPHFVFNALNSIQNFIFDKDISQANYFLSSFSKLMRSSLEMSKLDNVTLQTEVAFLKTYLELEQMRFPNLFDYSFKIDEEISLSHCLLPPLYLQPLLENAIKHGFKGIKYKGKLKIIIQKLPDSEDLIKIMIKDNGLGFKDSDTDTSEVKKKMDGHASMGLGIIQERISIINNQSGDDKASFKIEQKTKKQGTNITLILPVKFTRYDQISHH